MSKEVPTHEAAQMATLAVTTLFASGFSFVKFTGALKAYSDGRFEASDEYSLYALGYLGVALVAGLTLAYLLYARSRAR